jgi:hypothetical protein
MKRQEKIEALIRVRDYIRANVALLPENICNDFNLLAEAVGVEAPEGWCLFGVKPAHVHDQGFFMTAALAPLDPEYHYCPLCQKYIRETFHGSGVELKS